MDLNLLVVLDALLDTRSVKDAADRLQLSPPAVSRSLGRLRRATGDEILVRTGRTMTPTPRAVALRAETQDLVRRAATVLSPEDSLDLGGMNRTFVVRGHDALVGAISTRLTELIAGWGAGLGVTLLSESSGDDVGLARGLIDLDLVSAPPDDPDLEAWSIGSDRMVAVFRREHLLARYRLTARRLANVDHVAVSRRGRRVGPLDDALAELGLTRRIVAVLPTADVALQVVSRTNTVAVVAAKLCGPRIAELGLVTRALPVDVPPVQIMLIWHRRSARDPGNLWLRRTIADILTPLLDEAS